ncbi:MAG TPA: sortase [Gaiellaceae bacterium]|nr:sortase [Gaiellaceae bacterium]
MRWFGDYRGAVSNAPHTFCIDLQYWYPSKAYRFREDTSATLTNRDGETVLLENRRRLAYAIWTFGRTSDPSRQAAVMLYVHSLMGDARPGETDPSELGRGIPALFAQVARDSARYHGPYRIAVSMPSRLQVGGEGPATIRVLSATGNAVPGVALQLRAEGARAPTTATTDSRGVARANLRATGAGALSLDVRAAQLASTLPTIYAPTIPAAARNGQRIAVPASQVVTGSSRTTAAQTQVRLSSVAMPATVAAGGMSRDRLTIRNAAVSFKVRVSASLYGPFRSAKEISCETPPIWTGSFQTTGSGDYTTDPVKLDQTGWYVYVHDVPDDANHLGGTTPCTDPKERVKVVAQPLVYTVVSSQTAVPGAQISDRITVDGLAGEQAMVQAALYGPFSSTKAIRCSGKPVWSGTIDVKADGEYQTAPVTLTAAGYYTYRESIAGGEFVRPAQSRCGETAETTVVGGVHTAVSAEVVVPGGTISDRVQVLGLGPTARIEVELFGPFGTRAAIRCTGTPYWRGFVVARGDGVLRTPPVRLAKAGFYTFRERVVGSTLRTECAEVAETALARPLILTGRGDPVARAGAAAPAVVPPTRIRVASLGIDAPVFPVGISPATGALAVPPLIHRLGWWVDGMTPGSTSGSTLIAGHVDSATKGPGAFVRLKEARRGTLVEVTTKDGRTRTYRVVSVQVMPKADLPASIYSRRGRPRLVLVTCGGPFDASIGHYRDNVVVTAVPA